MFLLAVAAATVTAQQTPPARPQPTPPQQTFRGGVRAVPVYAAVTDGAGGFVTDLTKDDFEIKDNGKVQTITSFTTDLQPITTMIVLDGSGSMLSSFNAVIDGANAFIIRMLPDDRTRISSFADQIRLSPGYTNDRDALLEFLRNQFNLRMGNETRLWDAVDQAVLDLGKQEGRRIVLVFSDGYDTTSALGAGSVQADAIPHDVTIYALSMWTGRGSAATRPSGSLERLAQETGGGFYELHETDEMNSTFTKIALELHQQYLLAFEPQALDGKVHKLDVRVRHAWRQGARAPQLSGRGREMRAVLSLAVAAAAASLSVLAAQEQPRPYRGGTDVVAVYATVTDASGHLVPNLQKSDFIVSDNGKKQPIAVFSNDIQPITIVIMLDRSGSMAENFELVRDATAEFIGKLLPADKARIGSLSHDIVIRPEKFTDDKSALMAVVRYGLQDIGPSPVWTAVDRSITALLPEGGRRVVLLFSDGHDSPERGQVHTDVKDIMWRVEGGRDHGLLHRADERELPARRPDLSAAAPAGLSAADRELELVEEGRAAGSRAQGSRRAERRGLLRDGRLAGSQGDVRAGRRRAASPVRAGIRADEARQQGAQDRGEALA